MAWARPPGAPQLPSCPLEALEERENEYVSLIDKYGLPLVGAFMGVSAPALNNHYRRRPLYSGIWKHIVLGIGIGYLGLFIRDLRKEMTDERDEAMRQYIKLHPEDFPPYEKKLYKDVLEPWKPVR